MFDQQTLEAHLKTLFPDTLGIRFDELGPDKVTGSMLVRPELCTSGHTLHGGAFMAFADTLGAVATVMNLAEGQRTTTLESKTNFLAGAPSGTWVRGESTPVHKGRTTMVWQTRITREDGKLCALVTQTQMVIDGAR